MSRGASLNGTHTGVRTDTVELDHILEVVMKLFKLADQLDGYDDGWECPVEKPPSN